MPVRLKVFLQDSEATEFSEVKKIGDELFYFLQKKEIEKAFQKANSPGNSSSVVQNVFLEKALELGFQSEKKNLFSNIPTTNLRPDYYKKIKDSGIIIEVERGKTIMNNMDLLDMWKCHLCLHADHLFLFVPNDLKHNHNSSTYDCFKKVSDRLSPFFKKPNFVNVNSLWLFGY